MTAGWNETNFDSNENHQRTSANNENDTNTPIGQRIQGTSRKRNARKINSSNSPRAKKSRYDKAAVDIAEGLRIHHQIYSETLKKNDKLQADLDKLKNEKKIWVQKNATLVKEKKELFAALKEEKKKLDDEKKESEERCIALRNTMDEEKENEKKTLTEKNSALEKEMANADAEKKDLKTKIEELERFKNQMKVHSKTLQDLFG